MEPEAETIPPASPRPPEEQPKGRRRLRGLRLTCAGGLLLMLVSCGALAAVQLGPVALGLPGGNLLRVGSDDFVLSDFSFKPGSTRFVDWDGNGVRAILEFRQLHDTGALEVVLRYSTRDNRWEQRLLTLERP